MSTTLSRKWAVAYLSFDMLEKPWRIESSDTQLDWLLVVVGAKRSSYWDGPGWTYCERNAKRMIKEFLDLPSCQGWMDCWQEETVSA